MKKITFNIILLILVAGCALPIPHKRLHIYGVKSKLIDNETNSPVQNALIYSLPDKKNFTKSDKSGIFELPPVYAWHGGYFIGPISVSLLPGFDIAAPEREILIKAQGYNDIKLLVGEAKPLENGFIMVDEIRIQK